MLRRFDILIFFAVLISSATVPGAEISDQTEGCLICHEDVTPGIVTDWRTSRHATTSVKEALLVPEAERRVSVTEIDDSLGLTAVGCAECHTLYPEKHGDSFDHQGTVVHTVVSPSDCAVCHPHEDGQYQQNLMAYGYINLAENDTYRHLMNDISGVPNFTERGISTMPPDEADLARSCYYCHGTKVEVAGTTGRTTVFGELEFPDLIGWPNQGVGRINPDSSLGSCSACHARHAFSIEVARKPHTCSECHKGPDVPAYKVYLASKMGNSYASLKHEWDFDAVPWTVGQDFTAPTCATCHVSKLNNDQGEMIIHRSHQMSDRIYLRLFGLIYAHPHSRDPNTSLIRNSEGLQLPTELDGGIVASALINQQEQENRKRLMKRVCRSCHSSQWTDKHFVMLDETSSYTNELTLAATRLIQQAWKQGLAVGPAGGASPFDEAIERRWVKQWLYYANSTRYAAAMAGIDYGVFDTGRFFLSKNLREMHDWIKWRSKVGLED
jgi:hypothetical protein